MAIALCLAYSAGLVILCGVIIMLAGFLIRTIPRWIAPGQTLGDRLSFGGPVSNSLPLAMIIGFAVMPLVSCLSEQPFEMTLALAVLFVLIVIRRLTAGIRADLQTATASVKSILINRLLYDRSYQ